MLFFQRQGFPVSCVLSLTKMPETDLNPGQLIQRLISCMTPAAANMALLEAEGQAGPGVLPWHPQASAPRCLPRIYICQPGCEPVCWLSHQSCLSSLQGQRVTMWLVSLEQQHGSFLERNPFSFL